MRPVYQEKCFLIWLILEEMQKSCIGWSLKIIFQNKYSFSYPYSKKFYAVPERKNIRKIEKLDLKIEDFFQNFTVITNQKILEDNPILKLLDEKENLLINSFSELKSFCRNH
jgi:hypothetical protein